MLNFLYKAIHNGSCFTIRARFISTASNQNSFSVSYLINQCGFSPKSALQASRKVNFETPDNADLVISFFKYHGFSQTQISSIIIRHPRVLLSKPQNTFLPKLDFFMSKGLTSPDIATLLSKNPHILHRSLKNHIIPSFVFFKNLLGTNENTITAIKRFSGILTVKLDTCVVPNVNLLREIGVPESSILSGLKNWPRVITATAPQFKEIVEEVKEMGFNPSKLTFVLAVLALWGLNKSMWERRVNAYKRWGLSEEEILVAFRKSPWCIIASEDKIMQVMDFFVNKMGLEASLIVKHPVLLTLSLEKRMIPRGSVIEVLLSKGLVVKKNIYLPTVFLYSENFFLKKFVTPYKQEANDLLKLYNERLDLSKRISE
ncbi:transcription termination factor MTERF15, mitochondrial-like [Fagus crenata]